MQSKKVFLKEKVSRSEKVFITFLKLYILNLQYIHMYESGKNNFLQLL